MDDLNVCDWVIEEVRALQGLDRLKLPPKVHRYLTSVGWDCADNTYGLCVSAHITRQIFVELSVSLHPEGYVCTTYREHGQDYNFAYAYWRPDGQEPDYVCVCPTYESMDGEYRMGFLPYKAFCLQYANLDPAFERSAAELFDQGLLVETRAYPPSDDVKSTSDNLRLPLVLLAAHSAAVQRITAGGLMVHMKRGPVEHALRLTGQVPTAKFDSIYYGKTRLVRIGQKLVPVHQLAFMNPYNMLYSAWRELKVLELTSDLVTNLVSPAFAFYAGWCYLQGNEGLFENKAMLRRYALSSAISTPPVMAHDGSAEATEYARRLDRAAQYAKAEIEMSPYVMLHAIEDVGITVASYLQIVNAMPVVYHAMQDFLTDQDVQAGLLFCAVHALYLMHARVHATHGDLHSNNMTITIGRFAAQLWGLYTRKDDHTVRPAKYPVKNPVALYSLDERHVFLFPTRLMYPKIIDFSRAVLGPEFACDERVFAEQDERVAQIASHVTEGLTISADQVRANRQAAFELVCYLDLVAAARNVQVMFPTLMVAQALDQSTMRAAEALARHLAGAGPAPRTTETELLAGAFAAYRWTPEAARDTTCLESYHAQGPMPYAGTDPTRIPPWLTPEQFENGRNPFIKYVRKEAAAAHKESLLPNLHAENIAAEGHD